MIIRIKRLQTTLQMLACTALAAALVLPLGATAASSQKPSAAGKKPTVVKVADKKKAASGKKVVVTESAKKPKKQQNQVATAAKVNGKARATVITQTGKSKAQLAKIDKMGKKALLAQKSKLAKEARFAKKAPQHAKAMLVAHSRPPVSVVRLMPEPRLSAGERLGLRGSQDALELNSSVALVVDQDTSEVLFSKNDTAVLPIASLTKLMTGLVIADANLAMDELITINEDDALVYRNSRLPVGTMVTRGELMHLALMSSENRAANALGRTFPGGPEQFVLRMNAKARELGMRDTHYVEPTGLSSQNQSSARDLATLVSVAYERPILRSLSTSPSHQMELGRRTLQYNNSNRLISNPEWEIGLQKTGYISEAGRCLVMQAKVAGRKLIMVFLDSAGKVGRAQDAERVRRWVEAQSVQQLFVRPQG